MGSALAVDIGGTKLAAGVVSETGELLHRIQRPTPKEGGEAIFEALAGLVANARRGDEDVCGVGTGGPMTAGGEEVSPLNIPGWHRFPLRRRLAERCGLPTFVDNDAKALALGEGWV
ncbi:MAG TPA: ROK family protein, partial [Acidimicrobiales bacterium]|nr:ROK family protein [Acidimicrobiales bacterium]